MSEGEANAVIAKKPRPIPKWYDQIDELSATVDLEPLKFGTFHIVDATWADATAVGKIKDETEQTAMTIRAYCGPDSTTGIDGVSWPERAADKKAWTEFVTARHVSVVRRISDGIALFMASTNEDPDDENASGN